jgi:hypothetical protein
MLREAPRFKGTDLVFHVSSRRQQKEVRQDSSERAQTLSGFSDAKERLQAVIAAERNEVPADGAAGVAPSIGASTISEAQVSRCSRGWVSRRTLPIVCYHAGIRKVGTSRVHPIQKQVAGFHSALPPAPSPVASCSEDLPGQSVDRKRVGMTKTPESAKTGQGKGQPACLHNVRASVSGLSRKPVRSCDRLLPWL